MKKNKIKKYLINIFKSYHTILVLLILVSIVSLSLAYHVMKSSKIYMFNGKNDYVLILNGVIATDYNVNLLEGSDIEFLPKKDIVVTKYKIGYYALVNGKYEGIATIEGTDEGGFSLAKLLNSSGSFNLTATHYNKFHFTKSRKKAIDNKEIYFIINATPKKGEIINEKLKLDITKLSK